MTSINGNKRFYPSNNTSTSNTPSSHSSNYSSDSMSTPSSVSPPSSIDTSLYSQHEELIRFINDSWNKVYHQLKHYNSGHSSSLVKYYQPPNTAETPDLLAHFTPVDLEALWGRQLHQNLVQQRNV